MTKTVLSFVNCRLWLIMFFRRPFFVISQITVPLLIGICAVLWPFSEALAEKPSASKAYRVKSTPAVEQRNYGDRADVDQFIAEMVAKHQFNEAELKTIFGKAHYLDYVPRLMNPAPANFKRSWAVYRSRFLDQLRIREGVKFWRTHAKAVADASERYGIPQEIIIGIIGVETIYGRNTGDVRVVDALSTLAFDYPRRAEYFRSELENFLLLSRENKFEVIDVKGSFAGAIGIPQFMPGSIRKFATDFDGDGVIDLKGNPVDAIGSVAKFLADHGWQRGEPTHFNLITKNSIEPKQSSEVASLVLAGLTPKFTKSEIEAAGFNALGAPEGDTKYALIDLPNGDDPTSYFLGPQNFFVITRYNRSSFYAMAVIELGQAVKLSYQR